MTAPIDSIIRSPAPRTRLSDCAPSARAASIGLRANNCDMWKKSLTVTPGPQNRPGVTDGSFRGHNVLVNCRAPRQALVMARPRTNTRPGFTQAARVNERHERFDGRAHTVRVLPIKPSTEHDVAWVHRRSVRL